MRIESVAAEAFGALADARLDLAPGCTVVAGPNEAGKTTWFAATVAALAGRRRARGRRRADEQAFEDRHRPWDGGPWVVRAVVVLDDGRRVELRQDLAAATGTATDLALGRDVTAEILGDGVPDATRWVGLDRDAFAATAAVAQADVLAVTARAGVLQDHLQRAADRTGPDATAAAALERLGAFRSAAVGSPRAPTRPRARAEARRVGAEAALDAARDHHRRTAAAAEAADAARAEADAAATALVRAEQARAEVLALGPPLEPPLEPATESRPAPPPGWRAGRPGTRAVAGAGALAAALLAGGVLLRERAPVPAALVVALVVVALVVAAGVGWARARGVARARADRAARAAEERARHDAGIREARDRLAALDGAVRSCRVAHLAAEGEARHRAGGVDQLVADRPDVAAAEEELAAAQAECAHLDRLDATLATTIGFLERAQAEVHRSVAPVLAATAAETVAAVTAGRYREAAVDPERLAVTVRDPAGIWRDAALLSRGTAEPVYLALRVALADHLAARPGACPLLLDDVTVQCDPDRTVALADRLLDLAAHRQVVIFTQDATVVAWARRRLAPPRHRLVHLDGPAGPARPSAQVASGASAGASAGASSDDTPPDDAPPDGSPARHGRLP